MSRTGPLPHLAAAGITLAMTLPASPAPAGELALRVRQSGLAQLADLAESKLPTTIELPDFHKELFNCPATDNDIEAHVTGGAVELTWRDVDLRVVNGRLRIGIALDAEASANLRVDRAHACFGTLECQASLSARAIAAEVELEVLVGDDGGLVVRVADGDLDLGLSGNRFSIDSQGCLVGDAAEWAIEALQGRWVPDLVVDKIEDFLIAKVESRLTGITRGFAPPQLVKEPFAIDLTPIDVDFASDTGITVSADIGISVLGAAEDQSLPDFGATGSQPSFDAPGAVVAAVSAPLINEVLDRAWRAGMLHSALDDLALSLELSEDGMAQKLGLPGGTRIDARFGVGAPPRVELSYAEQGLLRIQLTDVAAEIDLAAPEGPSSSITILLSASLAAAVASDLGASALHIEPVDLAIDRLEITSGNAHVAADPARLSEFARAVLVPMLSQRLAGAPLAPISHTVDGAHIWVSGVQVSPGWLAAGVSLYVADPDDQSPPETRITSAPPAVPAGMATVWVAGTDSDTPEPLLRYVALLDGEPVSEEPTGKRGISFSTTDGQHLLEIAAVDVNGNIDPTPARHAFIADGSPPELEILEHPPLEVTGDAVRARWRASDDREQVSTRWEIRQLDADDAVGTMVRYEDFDRSPTELAVDDLERSKLYVLRIVARDRAGNVTSREFGFSLAATGGCSAGDARTASWLSLAVAALFLSLRRRRRRRWSVLGLGLALLLPLAMTSTSANAQPVGSNLSGPTDADGASSFWNPAAMHRGNGTRFDVGTAVSVVRLGFQPEETDGRSTTTVPKPEPTVGAYTDQIGRRWRLGFTVGVPQIDGAQWSREDDASYVTRWYANQARNIHATLTTSAAYRVNRHFAIGGGVTVLHSRLSAKLDKDMGKQLNLALGSSSADSPFPYASPAMAAPVELQTTGWGLGAVVGLLVEPSDRVAIGASVHTPATSHTTGTVAVDYPDAMRQFVDETVPAAELPELSGTVEADVGLPLMVFSAVAVEPAPRWELRVAHRYLQRSQVSNTDVLVVEATSPDVADTALLRGYTDRHSISLRAATALGRGYHLVAARARFESNSVNENSATPSNLDFNKLELGTTFEYRVSPSVAVIAQYSKYFLQTVNVDDSLHRPLAEPTLDVYNHPSPRGTYSGTADRFALWLSMFM